MSIDINWDTLTSGADGAAMAESVRAFVHEKFQQVPLPRFIRSVKVLTFDFGSVPPDLELKDICDPLPDFYEDDALSSPSEGSAELEPKSDAKHADEFEISRDQTGALQHDRHAAATRNPPATGEAPLSTPLHSRTPSYMDARLPGLRAALAHAPEQLGSPLLARAHTPGIPGGTSNLSYFHLPPLSAGLSGAATPLAAVAGAQFQNGWPDYGAAARSPPAATRAGSHHNRSASTSSLTPPSTADVNSRPTSRHQDGSSSRRGSRGAFEQALPLEQLEQDRFESPASLRFRERSVEDVQIVARVRYTGDVKLSLTAEINLDYPSPSFVGIPLKLNITGLTFDGVAILAYIKKRAHFCFLSPEDADTLVGNDVDLDPANAAEGSSSNGSGPRRARIGGLLEAIKVESEIGEKENGKQVLKNVGKVEKFVLDQVRRIFEDEFVYPSFWTFLV